MGKAAADNADIVIVTDDNPRSEDPAAIREAILAAAPGAIEIGDRGEAIAHAVAMLEPGDVLCVAGKGHETGQIVGDRDHPFLRPRGGRPGARRRGGRMTAPLWTWDAFLGADRRPAGRRRRPRRSPASPSTAARSSRAKPSSPSAATVTTGTTSSRMALAGGAATAVVGEDRLAALGRITGSLTVVDDVLDGARAASASPRACAATRRIAAITGSVGKTSTKEMLAAALAAEGAVHSSPASFNNHWGVPLTLARMPREAAYGVFEIGMNHAGEIEPLARMVRPHVAIVTTVEPVHLEYFKDVEGDRPRQGGDLPRRRAGRGGDHQSRQSAFRTAGQAGPRSRHRAHRRLRRARGCRGAARPRVNLKESVSCIAATVLGEEVSYKLGAPGRHLVQNSLAVLAAVSLLGGDLARAALALAGLAAGKGRGQRQQLQVPGGMATLIDESYNANPASMSAAIALLGQTEPGRNGRRIAILGDMLELGRGARGHARRARRAARGGRCRCRLPGRAADARAVGRAAGAPARRLHRTRPPTWSRWSPRPSRPAT